MKKTKNIRNTGTLEREIYRLTLECRNTEAQLDKNFDYLQENFSTLLMNSVGAPQKSRTEEKDGFFASLLKNKAVQVVLDKLTGHIAGRVADGLGSLAERAFHRK